MVMASGSIAEFEPPQVVSVVNTHPSLTRRHTTFLCSIIDIKILQYLPVFQLLQRGDSLFAALAKDAGISLEKL
jgi:hypothetical protein